MDKGHHGGREEAVFWHTAWAANTDQINELRREAKDPKEVVAEQTLELRLLKQSMTGGGGMRVPSLA